MVCESIALSVPPREEHWVLVLTIISTMPNSRRTKLARLSLSRTRVERRGLGSNLSLQRGCDQQTRLVSQRTDPERWSGGDNGNRRDLISSSIVSSLEV